MSENVKMDEQELSTGLSRRSLFHIIGAAPAVGAMAAVPGLAQSHDHAAAAATPSTDKGPYKPKVFNEHQWKTASVLADLIIPKDANSGSASDAGVPEFIDDWLDFRTHEDGKDNLQSQILGGLTWLDSEATKMNQKSFAEAPAEQQKKLLDRIAWPDRATKQDRPYMQFFSKFRDLTASGFYSSKLGIAALPYLGNRAVAEWKGCEPERWATIEGRMKNGYKGLTPQLEVKPWA